MSLNTLYGINGVGKDTVADEVCKRRDDILVTSMSRLLMYILEITKTYETKEKVGEEQYKKLESVSQNEMKRIEENEYKELLIKISQSDENVLMLAHLISALRHGDTNIYLKDRLTPNWFVELNDNLIELVAPAQIIMDRRANDSSRKRSVNLDEIVYHQSLCTAEWERIKNENFDADKKMFVVENNDLISTVDEISNIIFKNDKPLIRNRVK